MNSYVISRAESSPDWENIPALAVNEVLWLPDVGISMTQKLCYDDENIYVRQNAVEKNIRAEHRRADSPVCEDSCMEFFFSPCPEDGRYFNLEINPNGCFFLGIGHGRNDLLRLYPDKSVFDIHVSLNLDGWETDFRIPLSFIREFFPNYTFESGCRIRANCYKCGDLTLTPHYLAWNRVSNDSPDFHRPEYFGEMIFE